MLEVITIEEGKTLEDVFLEFADVEFLIEANSNEALEIWKDLCQLPSIFQKLHGFLGGLVNSNELCETNADAIMSIVGPMHVHSEPLSHEQHMGFMINIGNYTIKCHNGEEQTLPLCISFSFASFGGHKVCFYDVKSVLNLSHEVKVFLKKNYTKTYDGGRWRECDSLNAGAAISVIRRLVRGEIIQP